MTAPTVTVPAALIEDLIEAACAQFVADQPDPDINGYDLHVLIRAISTIHRNYPNRCGRLLDRLEVYRPGTLAAIREAARR